VGEVTDLPRRALRRLDKLAFGRPHDPTPGWSGLASVEGRPLRVARFGSCELRAMDGPHGTHTPVGYPRRLAEVAAEQGLAIEFGNVFVGTYEDLPRTREELWRYLRLSGDPDVVLVHVGGMYGYRVILPVSRRIVSLREKAGRAVGRLVFGSYRVLNPLARRMGRYAVAYHGGERLDAFLSLLEETWPQASVHVLLPLVPLTDGAFDRPLTERIAGEIRTVAARHGLEAIDPEPVTGDPRLRCANGVNLNSAGSEAFGDRLAEAVLARWR
jgi:hypothetical protein